MDNNLLEILEFIPPSQLDYNQWCQVGMALKHEGYSVSDWDLWSKNDTRYHTGECEKKWQTFENYHGDLVKGGTIVSLAREFGYTPPSKTSFKEYDWDDVISVENTQIVNSSEGMKLYEPTNFNPVSEIIKYLETLFEPNENVGYVTETWQNEDGKYLPTKGSCDRTAGELIELLSKCNGDIGAVLGDYNEKAGAWIRFNPLDGKGVKNDNVTEYKYALVESDTMSLEQQNSIIRELELPVAIMVYSGGKSIHAIVKVDAPNYEEYRKRVDFLYKVCENNGLVIDRQNRNPSRLSRLPGVKRGDKLQYIIDTNIGKSDWNDWKDYIEGINDDLPNLESIADVWDNLPELSPPLISGVLRQGHKMLIAGPSKAGKSFALIELCCAIAEGKKWLGFECTQGKVLYVNLELDRASCLHRFSDVYKALGYEPNHLKNIDIWNLRGKSVPMDKLAPKLIRRAKQHNYIAIVIDPIYKVITGDENSADQMAHFCNQFDKVCTELNSAVIYCHHHSKGFQAGKRSMDRASGSGVFARDPDALLDMTELEITEKVLKNEENKLTCKICADWISRFKNLDDVANRDELCSALQMLDIARKTLPSKSYGILCNDINTKKEDLKCKKAWRIEGTLREFQPFKPLNVWFEYPIHRVDSVGILEDLHLDNSSKPQWQKAMDSRKSKEEKSEERKQELENAFNSCNVDGKVTIQDLMGYLNCSERTIRYRVNEHPNFSIKNNEVQKTE